MLPVATVARQIRSDRPGGSDKARIHMSWVVAFMALHVPLAILMRSAHSVASFHAIACLAISIVVAATASRIQTVAVLAAYIAGSEVLWRMNHAAVFWEFGKYAASAVFLIAFLRIRVRRNRGLAFAYFAFLLPSIVLTFAALDFDAARQQVSFYLSGPLVLALGALYFSNVRFDEKQMLSALLAFVGPVVGIGTLSVISTLSHSKLDFSDQSNFAASAGFGPNEVAAVLGLAAMFALLIVIDRRFPWRLRLPMFPLAVILASLTALTFARGGLVLAGAGLTTAAFFYLRGNVRGRATVMAMAVCSFAIGRYVIEPRLESLTGGELSQRYTTLKTSGRNVLIESELEFFQEHPILGVGPGIGTKLRTERGELAAPAHTEYSRMLGEHGIFGLLSLFCLIGLGIRALRSARDLQARAYAGAMVIWVALFLLVYDTRIFAPAFVLGLAFGIPSVIKKRAPRVAPMSA